MDIEQNNRELSVLLNNVRNKVITRGGQLVLSLSDLTNGGESTGATVMEANKFYIANNVSQVVFTLPATFEIGDYFGVIGKGAGGWKIQAVTGQVIHWGYSTSISAGSIQSQYYKDVCIIYGITANTDLAVIWSAGSPEIETS